VAPVTGARGFLFTMDLTLSTTGRSRTLLAVLVAVGRTSIGAARTWVPRLKASIETLRNCILAELIELEIARGRNLEE